MPFNVKQRGKLTYYYQGDRPVLSALVTEEQPDGDLKIYFAGLTGGYSAQGVLGREELVSMDPHREIPLVFQSWEHWLREAGICDSLRDVDFIAVHLVDVPDRAASYEFYSTALLQRSPGPREG